MRRISPSSLGRWSARHPWRAIVLWLAFVVFAVAALAVTGSNQLQSGAVGESARAERMLMVHMARPGQSEFAYLHSDTLNVRDPAFRAAIAKVTGGNGSRAWRSRHN
jgi:putative drug exporter of the RND superfamily